MINGDEEKKKDRDVGHAEVVPVQDTDVHINVTPIFVDHPEAVCKVEPQGDDDERFVRYGMIILPRGMGSFMLHFHLQDGVAPDLAFAEDRPWSCRPQKCPDLSDNNDSRFPSRTVHEEGKLLKVRAAPAGRNAWHYSLNFNGSVRCDPIIIHD